MAKIQINNPRQIINGGAKKYYFKVKGLGGPKGDKGDKGDTGATGPQGPQGNTATVSVGSTTTLPVGYDATVTNSGSIYNAVLDFGIPQGPQGPQGAKGDKGDTGAQGETGPRGPQGERGTNATVYVGTTTTTNPGTQARVYNSGTDSNAVLNFEIPRGNVGPQPELVQTTGTSTTKAMSQNATTVALAAKQNTLTAGANIQISNGTISATDTTYTAGNGLNLNGTEFSADTDILATKEDLEGYYTKPETDTKLAPKLEAEVVAELPTTGEEGKLYLTPKAHTTQTATGNPITATITEQAGKMESFQLDGDTFQQSYTGKNLIAVTQTEPQTRNGVTCTWDGASFTLNGTSTAGVEFCGRGWWGATSNPIALPAGTYTISLRKRDGSLATDTDLSVDCYYGTTHIIGIYRGQSGAGYQTLTLDSDTQYTVLFISIPSNKTYNNEKFYIQLEKSDSPTTWEPYVGGQPSPSPEYPQPIQTVTGEQTVTVVGKNLFDKDNYNILNCWPVSSIAHGNNWSIWIPCEPNTTYSVTKMICQPTDQNRFRIVTTAVKPNYGVAVVNAVNPGSGNTTGQITTGATAKYLMVTLANTDTTPTTTLSEMLGSVQIEVGSATPYSPYSKQTYTIDLGSIELCKIGDYQDYIYKDGENWKVHKATSSVTLTGQENWSDNWQRADHTNYIQFYLRKADFTDNYAVSTIDNTKCNHFAVNPISPDTVWQTNGEAYAMNPNVTYTLQFKIARATVASLADWRTWLASNPTTVYYALATPTDTVITDTNLIAQLEAIRTASLENGANTITNTATGSNLAGDMKIGYYGYNPRNRYDKWLWLDLNNAYEQLNNPDTSSTLSTLSTRSLGATTEQPTVTRSLETETITLKKGETEPIEDKTELPTTLDEEAEEAEETETTEPEESDGTDER